MPTTIFHKTTDVKFDELYKRASVHTEDIGDHADLKYEEGVGLYAKPGLRGGGWRDILLRIKRYFNGHEHDRRKAFASGADAVINSINAQFPKAMKGDLTLGEHIVQSVLNEKEGEYRVNMKSLNEIRDEVEAHKKDLNNADDSPAVNRKKKKQDNHNSTVWESRFSQNAHTRRACKNLMTDAVLVDAERHFANANDPSASDPSSGSEASDGRYNIPELLLAKEVNKRIGNDTELTFECLEDVRSLLEERGINKHAKLDELYRLVALRDGLDTSRRAFMALNEKDDLNHPAQVVGLLRLRDMGHKNLGGNDSLEKAYADAKDERRDIVRDMQFLDFPDGLMDDFQKRYFYERLKGCAETFLICASELQQNSDARDIDAHGGLNPFNENTQERAFDVAYQQGVETLALAALVRPTGYNDAAWTDKKVDETPDEEFPATLAEYPNFHKARLQEICEQFPIGNLKTPKRIYQSQNRERSASLAGLTDHAAREVRNVADALVTHRNEVPTEFQHEKRDQSVTRAELDQSIVRASILNGRMIAHAQRRLLMCPKEDADPIREELKELHAQRAHLNRLNLNLLYGVDPEAYSNAGDGLDNSESGNTVENLQADNIMEEEPPETSVGGLRQDVANPNIFSDVDGGTQNTSSSTRPYQNKPSTDVPRENRKEKLITDTDIQEMYRPVIQKQLAEEQRASQPENNENENDDSLMSDRIERWQRSLGLNDRDDTNDPTIESHSNETQNANSMQPGVVRTLLNEKNLREWDESLSKASADGSNSKPKETRPSVSENGSNETGSRDHGADENATDPNAGDKPEEHSGDTLIERRVEVGNDANKVSDAAKRRNEKRLNNPDTEQNMEIGSLAYDRGIDSDHIIDEGYFRDPDMPVFDENDEVTTEDGRKVDFTRRDPQVITPKKDKIDLGDSDRNGVSNFD